MTRAQEIADRLKTLPAQTSLEVMHGLTLRKTANGVNVSRLHYSAHPDRDPQLHPEWKTAERKAYPSQSAWDREQEIVDEAGGGELVFADVLITHWDEIVIEDPAWRPDGGWDVIGGFDHGKTNPTALVRAYVDYEGNIIFAGEYYMPGREIWQHAPVIRRMEDFERMETIQADPSIFHSTSQQVQRPGHAIERAKSFAELYDEQGVTSLVKFCGDPSDVSFAGRLHQHWANPDERKPSVRIFCPKGMYTEKPRPGLHDWGCPDLLWELMRARRVKLTAQQLLSRNTSEAIEDKDNHARDAMKYVVMSLPEASRKPLGQRETERLEAMIEEGRRTGLDPGQAMTSAVLRSGITHEEQEEDAPTSTYYGRNARHWLVEIQREKDRRRRGGR
jgi:hypothetical protein